MLKVKYKSKGLLAVSHEKAKINDPKPHSLIFVNSLKFGIFVI